MLGLGVDTGGTYTDSVIFDLESKTILCSAKSPTTKERLEIGITASLAQLDKKYFPCVKIVSLSTTLATNACVEDKGGRSKLIFIGVDERVIKKVGGSYGLPDVEEIYFLDYKGTHYGDILIPPDWDKFNEDAKNLCTGYSAAAIVDIHSVNNGSVLERKAREVLSAHFDGDIICGYELSSELNSVKRGAGALLNARLIPIIREFIASMKVSLRQFDISAPMVLVRSDGSVMSENFTELRPVETLLCGPCASVMGGITLAESAGEKISEAVIIDMGGTTTDMAIIRNGMPLKAKKGISIGNWRTAVKGIYIKTFGLGGDSEIGYDRSKKLTVGSNRVLPISRLAQSYPAVLEKLEELLLSERTHTHFLNEFAVHLKDIDAKNEAFYYPEEVRFVKELKKNPMTLAECAVFLNTDLYRMNLKRLEADGYIIKSGLTPTDVMNIKGDFVIGDTKAAELSAKYIAANIGMEYEKFLDFVFESVAKILYSNIVRMLMEEKYGGDVEINQSVSRIIEDGFYADSEEERNSGLQYRFTMPLKLIGVGAPIKLFCAAAAQKLNAEYLIPGKYEVANAIGAVVGNIYAEANVEIKLVYDGVGIAEYIVYGKVNTLHTESFDEAREFAVREAENEAVREAKLRGASGDVEVNSGIADNKARLADGSEFLLGVVAKATAVGRFTI